MDVLRSSLASGCKCEPSGVAFDGMVGPKADRRLPVRETTGGPAIVRQKWMLLPIASATLLVLSVCAAPAAELPPLYMTAALHYGHKSAIGGDCAAVLVAEQSIELVRTKQPSGMDPCEVALHAARRAIAWPNCFVRRQRNRSVEMQLRDRCSSLARMGRVAERDG